MADPATAEPGPPPPPPVPPAATRPPFRRSSSDRWLTGVAGGIARTLGVPAWVVRGAIVLLTMAGGLLFVAYLALWLFVPDDSGRVLARELVNGNESWLPVAGVVLLAIAVVATLGILGGDELDILVPIALIGGGAALLAESSRPRDAAPAPTQARPFDPNDGPVTATTPDPTTATYPPVPPPSVAPYEVVRPAPRVRPSRARPFLTPLTLSALAIAAGITFLLDRGDELELRVGSALAVAMITMGAVLVVATWVGRARGLIAVGLVLLPFAALTAAVDLPFHKGIGEQTFTPVEAIDPLTFVYGIGEMRVDLRSLRTDGTAMVEAELGVGSLVVLVPRDVNLDVAGEVGAGQIIVTEQPEGRFATGGPYGEDVSESGLGAELDRSFPAESETADRIDLTAEVGLGEVVIRRVDPSS